MRDASGRGRRKKNGDKESRDGNGTEGDAKDGDGGREGESVICWTRRGMG